MKLRKRKLGKRELHLDLKTGVFLDKDIGGALYQWHTIQKMKLLKRHEKV